MAALVTSILGLVPVALGLSIAALVRMKSQAQKGLGLVIGALSVCGAWAALATLFVVVGVLGGWDYKSIGSISEVASAEVGTCLNADPPSVEDCASSHDLEVFFAPTLPDPVWPGTGDVASEADALCEEAFEPYVGTSYSSSDLDYEFYAPTEAEWAAGKHKVVCVITLSGDDLVGSVHGSGNSLQPGAPDQLESFIPAPSVSI